MTAELRAEQMGFGFGIGSTLDSIQLVAADRNQRKLCVSRSLAETLPRALARWCTHLASP